MKANKKRQTIEMHFRYNKIYGTAASSMPSTRRGAILSIFSSLSIHLLSERLSYTIKNPCDFGCLFRLVLRTDFNPNF